MRVRVTSRSKPAGDPYGLRGAPAIVMPGGISGGAAALSLPANAMKAPAAAAPPFKKTRRSSSPFPAAAFASLSRRSSRRERMAPSVEATSREGSRAAPHGQYGSAGAARRHIYSDEHDGAPSRR